MTQLIYPAHLAQEAAAFAAARREALYKGQTANTPTAAPDLGTLDPGLGRFGGIVQKEIRAGNMLYPPGVFVGPEVIMGWPLKNRHAMAGAGKIAYFHKAPTDDDLVVARVAAEKALMG